MRNLQDFATNNQTKLFKDAQNLPVFFQNNLVDPARVVKAFHNDPQANIRVFYYQYLKLCFQLQTVNYQFYIHKIEQIINNEDFKFMFYEDDDPQVFNDMQFKRLIMQFFGVLGQGETTIEDALNHYPIMDTVFIYFFRAILILTGKTDSLQSYIDRDSLLEFLGGYFGVEISVHDKCIKFVETDIFVYEEDPKEVFMAFMDYQNEPFQNNPLQLQQPELQTLPPQQAIILTSSPVVNTPVNSYATPPAVESVNIPNQLVPPVQNQGSRRPNTEINQSYIASEFVDYTSNNQPTNLMALAQNNNLKESGSIDGSVKNAAQKIQNNFYDQAIKPKEQLPVVRASTPTNNSIKYEQPKKVEVSTPFKSSYNDYQSDYSSKIQTNFNNYQPAASAYVPTYAPPTTSNPSFSKSNNFIEVSSQKKIQQSYLKSNNWQPTKDPGFNIKTNNDYAISQYAYKTQITSQIPSNKNVYESYQVAKKPASYVPSFQQPKQLYQDIKKPTSYDPLVKPNVNPIYSPISQPAYQPSYQPQYNQYGAGKNPFGLNVSQQFTNSFTMKSMAEPYRTNVLNIRQRARNFRNSLNSLVK